VPARASALLVRLLPMLDDDAPSENYALRLTEALEAISPRKLADHYPRVPRDLGLWLDDIPSERQVSPAR